MIITSSKSQTAQFLSYAWFNGQILHIDELKLPALTHSLHYSGAAFEGEKAYDGKIFKLKEHVDRLLNSARTLMMDVPYSSDELIAAHHEVIQKNAVIDAYIRPLIWRGAESLNIANKLLSVNAMICVVASSPKFNTELNIHISRWEKPSPNSMPPQCKSSGHYNMMIICKEEANVLGFDDAILLDGRGYIAECTTSNIFFVQDNELFTPIPDYFLDGITRRAVIEIAGNIGIKVNQEYISASRINEFEECFITGTAAEVRTVKSISTTTAKVTFHKNELGNILQQQYMKMVRG